jgi:PKD repeat protein
LTVTFEATEPTGFQSWELLDGGSVLATGTTTAWSYDFPAGATGVYTIRQLRTAGADPIEEDFRINRAPVPAFDAPVGSGPLPLTVQFQNTSSDDYKPEAMSWQWNFNFGFPGAPWTSNLQNPQFTYTNPGTYAVVLTVTDADFVQSTTSRQITIPGAPATPVAPEWVDGDVTFDPVPGASRYRVVTTHTGFESDGSPCLRSGVNATLAATGPFEVNGGTNTCPVGPKSTSATLAVEANGIWSAPSLPAVRSVP